jgi:uncharacterized protein YbjT (DUF2867 family)
MVNWKVNRQDRISTLVKQAKGETMFLVSGITGHVGGAAARQLLKEGKKVRALLRDPKKAAEWVKQGVDVRQGDFNDAASIAGALQGVEGAFFMLPPILNPGPGFPEAQAMTASLRQALRQAPPRRVVVLSSIGSQQTSRLGLITATHLMERGLSDLPVPIAFIRAGSFFENYTYGLKAGAATGWFDVFLTPTDRPVPMIATEDIGNEVARLLVNGWEGKKIVELGTRISPDELAIAIGEVLGRPVKARSIPRANWTAAIQAQGMPPAFAAPFEEMNDSINSGWIDFGAPGTEEVAGKITPREFFKKANQG